MDDSVLASLGASGIAMSRQCGKTEMVHPHDGPALQPFPGRCRRSPTPWVAAISLIGGLQTLGACYTPPPLDSGAALRMHRSMGTNSSALSGSDASKREGLTEDDAVRKALTGSPRIETARANVGEARGNAVRARAFDNPEFHVDNGFLQRGNNSQDRDVYKLGLSLRFPLPSFAERPARIDASDAAVDVAERNERLDEVRIQRDIRLAYAQATAAQTKLALFGRLADTRRAREKSVAAAVQGGHAVAMELAQLRVAVSEALDSQSRAEEDLAETQATLTRLLGFASPPPEALALGAAPVCHPPPSEDTNALEERALTGSPALERLRATHRQAEDEARAEHLASVPRVKFIELGYTRNTLLGTGPSTGIQDIEPRYYSWSVHANLGLDLPVWNLNGGRIRTAEARLSAETAHFQEALSATLSGLRRSLLRWRQGHDRAERARSVTIPAAEEALKLTRQAVEGMRLPASASLQAEEKLILVQLQLIDDLLQCRTQEAEVEAIVGDRAR